MSNLSDRNKKTIFVSAEQSPDKAGLMKETAEDAIPDGWLECNGQVVLRADYPDLFAAIGTTYNTGGELGTEFRLPPNERIGKTDGVAVSAGQVGENVTEAATPLSVPNGASGVISTIDNITLQPGVWLVMANGSGRALSGATNGTLYLSEVNGAATGAVLGQTQHNFAITNGAGGSSIVTIKNLTVADTFYLGLAQTGASASAGTIEGSIVAVRIA